MCSAASAYCYPAACSTSTATASAFTAPLQQQHSICIHSTYSSSTHLFITYLRSNSGKCVNSCPRFSSTKLLPWPFRSDMQSWARDNFFASQRQRNNALKLSRQATTRQIIASGSHNNVFRDNATATTYF